METIKLNDLWVQQQLTDCLSSRQKLRFELKNLSTSIQRALGRGGFSIPLVPIELTTELIARFVREEIENERKFIGHSKILESRGFGSVTKNLESIIEKLPDFQAYIYMTDEFFRDHIEHQIRVAVLGNLILSRSFHLEVESKLLHTMSSKLNMKEDDVIKA